MAVTDSILLYRCEIWSDALKMEKYRKRMHRWREEERSEYRTVSDPVVLVISAVIPIDVLTLEHRGLFKRRDNTGRDAAEDETGEISGTGKIFGTERIEEVVPQGSY